MTKPNLPKIENPTFKITLPLLNKEVQYRFYSSYPFFEMDVEKCLEIQK